MTLMEQKKALLLESISNKYYSDLTDIQKVNLSEFYAHSGCFYMAVSNSFASYMTSITNGEQIFRHKFGFDLYSEIDGQKSLNLEAIAYDLFLSQIEDTSYEDFIKTNPGFKFNFQHILNNYFTSHGIEINLSSSIDTDNQLKVNHSVEGLQNKAMAELLNNPNRYNILFASS